MSPECGQGLAEMCKCTPGVKTPFCGAPGCQWHQETRACDEDQIARMMAVEALADEIMVMGARPVNERDVNHVVQSFATGTLRTREVNGNVNV